MKKFSLLSKSKCKIIFQNVSVFERRMYSSSKLDFNKKLKYSYLFDPSKMINIKQYGRINFKYSTESKKIDPQIEKNNKKIKFFFLTKKIEKKKKN